MTIKYKGISFSYNEDIIADEPYIKILIGRYTWAYIGLDGKTLKKFKKIFLSFLQNAKEHCDKRMRNVAKQLNGNKALQDETKIWIDEFGEDGLLDD